jgi:23S rRNA (cytosine1962-C5)-methyltransferase
LDAADGEKLELWGGARLIRPDPQVIWKEKEKPALWRDADAVYHRSAAGGGSWDFRKKLPESWKLDFAPLHLKFIVRPTGFKHTGLFPEQAANWLWFSDLIRGGGREIRALNLFAYTGGATAACAAAGASVTHVDAAQGMLNWAKENLAASGLGEKPARFLRDDCLKFVRRELRRGNRYDAVIMDPPSYGRGPNKEVWKLEDEIYGLASDCAKLLSEKPLFFLINSYTTGLQPTALANILKLTVGKRFGGTVEAGEAGLPIQDSALILPCGCAGRWRAA